MAPDAVDQDGSLNPDFAKFVPVLLTLDIGGEVATVTSPELRLSDDAFDLFDSITLQTQAELFGTTLSFSANVRLPLATFELASPAAPDPPPSFADTLPIQFGGAATSSLVTIPQNETVTGTLEICGESPEPAVWTMPTTGTAAGVDLTLANIASPALVRGPLQGPISPRLRSARSPCESATTPAPIGQWTCRSLQGHFCSTWSSGGVRQEASTP